jgi:glucose/arabinose dehydrogenase
VPDPADQNYPGAEDRAGWEARINVPAGFDVAYYGRVPGAPTSITFGPDGQLYIATQEGNIYRMDASGSATFYVGGFIVPTGIAFQPGTNRLFVASRVRDENVGGESQIFVVNEGQLIGGLPCCYTGMHAANGIEFGPDGMGYVGVGARADHGEVLGTNEQDTLHPLEASILRFDPNTGAFEVYARGLRNPYDIAWDAAGQLWATDNAPDYGPPEEVHRIVPGGQHGYPWYDCDVCFSPPADVQVLPPTYTFVPHASPTGITAYTGSQFPSNYFNNLFVTLWSAFPGAQKVMRLAGGPPTNFATGFAAPIDVVVGPDGSLFVADWATGIIFRIYYVGG